MSIILGNDLQPDSIVDGLGIRTVIWTQGCHHHCKACHNPELQSFNKGKKVAIEEIKKQLLKLKGQDGITLSGGEPFCQPEACFKIASYAKYLKLNVWCYSGYTFEELLLMAKEDDKYMKLLTVIDILIDGPFILEQKTFNFQFRGSSNQRIIDVPKSLKKGKTINIKKFDSDSQHMPSLKEEGLFV